MSVFIFYLIWQEKICRESENGKKIYICGKDIEQNQPLDQVCDEYRKNQGSGGGRKMGKPG